MLGSKFSKQLTTGKRKWLTELREGDAAIGGWNPDATDSDRPMSDLSDAVNVRKLSPGDLRVRSGYRQWRMEKVLVYGTETLITPNGPPLAKCEYRLDNVFVDVTMIAVSGTLYAVILHPSAVPLPAEIVSNAITKLDMASDPAIAQAIAICPCGANPIVSCRQYETFIVISVVADDLAVADGVPTANGYSMFALMPDGPTLTTWRAPMPVGQVDCPAPLQVGFSQTAVGKLLAFIPTGVTDGNDGTSSVKNHTVNGYQTDPITGEFVTSALDINAPYFLRDATTPPPNPFANFAQPLWRPNQKDPLSGTIDSRLHLKSRGWLYRVTFKRKFLDPRGNEVIVASAPSTDIYVEDRIYCPPVIVVGGLVPQQFPGVINQAYQHAVPPGVFPVPNSALNNVDAITVGRGFTASTALPTVRDFTALRQKFIDAVGMVEGPTDLLFFVAAALGAAGQHEDIGVIYQAAGENSTSILPGSPPYKLNASSYEINQSPNAVFNWTDFTGLPSDAYAIDIYRTAYCYPNPIESNTKGTGFSPFNYGYVGTIQTGTDAALATFVDNIQDVGIDFSQSPLTTDGYLEGWFAGEVSGEYQDSVVLGNTRSKYWLRTPWRGMQGVIYPNISGTGDYSITDFVDPVYGLAPDGLTINTWYYSYADADGLLSDASLINLTLDVPDGTTGLDVAFVFPRGYSQSISQVLLVHSIFWDTEHDEQWIPGTSTVGHRRYWKEAYVDVTVDGHYLSIYGAVPTGIGEITPTVNTDGSLAIKTIKQSTDPGAVIWSATNNLWSWPTINFENEFGQQPITAMEDILGRLYVYSDIGIINTLLDGVHREPVQKAGTGAGSISRFAAVKVGQVFYTMTANGLIFTSGSGVVPMPASILTEVQLRLRERIPGGPQPLLFGTRNLVSMSYLQQRSELWITFPSTIPLGGSLPARTFVLRFFERPTYWELAATRGGSPSEKSGGIYAYEFEVASPNPTGLVVYCPHADGSLFCSFYDPGDTMNPNPSKRRNPALVVQDNDVDDLPWPSDWAFQYQSSLGAPSTVHQLFTLRIQGEVSSKIYLKTGMLRSDGGYDRQNGTIDPLTPLRELVVLGEGHRALYSWPISGSLLETAGAPAAIRIYGKPSDIGENTFSIEAFDIYYGLLHGHKGD